MRAAIFWASIIPISLIVTLVTGSGTAFVLFWLLGFFGSIHIMMVNGKSFAAGLFLAVILGPLGVYVALWGFRSDEQRNEDELRQRLIRKMQSKDNSIALNALQELRAHGWLRDGSLEEANLDRVNLQGAKFGEANLPGVSLAYANLQEVDLEYTNLQGAILWGTNLQGSNAGLAKFDEETALPDDNLDGKRSYWSSDTDMTRFTDPDHPNFWRSDDPMSPAYRGKSDEPNADDS